MGVRDQITQSPVSSRYQPRTENIATRRQYPTRSRRQNTFAPKRTGSNIGAFQSELAHTYHLRVRDLLRAPHRVELVGAEAARVHQRFQYPQTQAERGIAYAEL